MARPNNQPAPEPAPEKRDQVWDQVNHQPAPEKAPAKPGFGRNLAGFTGQALVALLGVGAVAPFRATEILLTATGQTVQLVGAGIYCTGLGISWVGGQVGRPGDAAGAYAHHLGQKVKGWRTGQPQPESPAVPFTAYLRESTSRQLAAVKEQFRQGMAELRAAVPSEPAPTAEPAPAAES
jgi:hypothetical protein